MIAGKVILYGGLSVSGCRELHVGSGLSRETEGECKEMVPAFAWVSRKAPPITTSMSMAYYS